MSTNRFVFLSAVILAVAGVLAGCKVLPRDNAVPPVDTVRASPIGFPDVRYWPEIDARPLLHDSLVSMNQHRRMIGGIDSISDLRSPLNLLALSGGGDGGAFGAGLLVGWTEEGTRPQFDIVTGISAGALLAPFAYLGSNYDFVLSQVCDSVGPRDFFRVRNVLTALAKDGLADDRPLEALIARYVTKDTLEAVAREYAKGGMLLIGTTNLDSRQRVIWNMGAIASSPSPGALPLFRQIMLASTAIPGVFPPVMIDVELDGVRYQEMHVDGGVMNQAFLLPPALLNEVDIRARLKRRIYVVRNGYLTAKWVAVPRRTTAVAGRALSSLLEAQGLNDLYRLERGARDDNDEFRFAFIEADFTFPHPREFDAQYIHHLFEYGLQRGRRGYAWHNALPEITPSMVRDWIATAGISSPRNMLTPDPFTSDLNSDTAQ